MRQAWTVSLMAALSASTLLVSGCVASSPPPSAFCVPRVMVEPTVVSPGDTITMTSDTTCDVPPPDEGWSVVVAPVGAVEQGVRTTTTDDFDGTFSLRVTLSTTFPEGEAFAGIENWDYSDCADNASCASASGSFTVR